jgi:hypothetical protein
MRYLLLSSSSIQNRHAPKPKYQSVSLKLVQIAVLMVFLLSAISQLAPAYAARDSISVTSNGVEEPYIIQQVASASNPNTVYQITGAQIAQRQVGHDLKSYLYLYINTGKTFAVNSTGETAKETVSGYSTTNIYWNAETPPGSGRSGFYGTVGQDLDTGATSNTLSEWQWTNFNWGGGGKPISYTGSYDGGGPTACHTYSDNQERESVYVIIVDSGAKTVYQLTGAVLIQQDVNGVESTTFIALVSGTQGKLVTSGDKMDCPEVANPSVTPSLRWYVRTPPVKGKIPGATITGNFGITGTLGAGVTKAPEDGSMEFQQFMDRTFQTGYIPNEGCATCISMKMSTNPVGGATAAWPG